MEYLEVSPQMYDNIQGTNDLDMVADHISAKRKKKLQKKITAGKFKGKRLKKKQAIVAGTRQTLGGRLLGVATGGLSKLTTKAGRTEVKKAGKIAVKIAENIALLPLLPLLPMMKKTLKQKGVRTGNTPLEITNAFYTNVVKKTDHLNPDIDLLEIDSKDHLAVAIGAVVSAIIAFVKGIKKKKASGETLSKIEQTIATGTDIAEKVLNEKAQTETATTVGSKLLFDRKTQFLIIGIIAAVVIIAVIIARKK